MTEESKRMRQLTATQGEWAITDPELLDGEMAISSDVRDFKVGPGKWSTLPYWKDPRADAIRNAFTGRGLVDFGSANSPENAMFRHNLTKQGSGSGNVLQGFCVDPFGGDMFTLHVTGSPTELGVINRFNAHGRRYDTSTHVNTPDAQIGHVGLDISWDQSGQRWLWCSGASDNDDPDTYNIIKRFQVTKSGGGVLTTSNIGTYRLIDGGGGFMGPCVSVDGRYMVADDSSQSSNTKIYVYDLQEMMKNGPGDYRDGELWSFEIPIVHDSSNSLQGMACDGNYVYVISGDSNLANPATFQVYTMFGELVWDVPDFSVGKDSALGDGAGDFYEVQGMGWHWQSGQPVLGITVASGDSGARVNRIWLLHHNMPHASVGTTEYPAFLSAGTNDYGVIDGETMRFGEYDPDERVFTEHASISPSSGEMHFNSQHGSVTMFGYDDEVGGNQSPTSFECKYTVSGDLCFFRILTDPIDTSGMVGSNNFYIRGLPFPNLYSTPLACTYSNVNLTLNHMMGYVNSSDNLLFREMGDNTANLILNVDQVSGAVIVVSGVYTIQR